VLNNNDLQLPIHWAARMNRGFRIVALAAPAFIAGCDPIYGISRNSRLSSLPELDCVESAIRSVPRVTTVRRWYTEGSRPLALTGIKPPDHDYYFSYEVEDTGASLYLSVNYRGEVEYSQHLIKIGSPPPQKDIDVVRPVMVEVETALESRCNVRGLHAAIEESCSGVTCEAK